jgi:hypothetical protein
MLMSEILMELTLLAKAHTCELQPEFKNLNDAQLPRSARLLSKDFVVRFTITFLTLAVACCCWQKSSSPSGQTA